MAPDAPPLAALVSVNCDADIAKVIDCVTDVSVVDVKVNVYVDPAVPVTVKFVKLAIPLTADTVVVPPNVPPELIATVTEAELLETVAPPLSPIAILGCVARILPEEPPTALTDVTSFWALPETVSELESASVYEGLEVNVSCVLPELSVNFKPAKVATPPDAVAVVVPETAPLLPDLIAAVIIVALSAVLRFP